MDRALQSCPWQTQDQCMAVKMPVAEIQRILEMNTTLVVKPLNDIIVDYVVPAKNIEWKFQQPSLAANVKDHVACLITLMGNHMFNNNPPEAWPLDEWANESEILTLFAALHQCSSRDHDFHCFHIRCAIKWCEDNNFAVSRRYCRNANEVVLRMESVSNFINEIETCRKMFASRSRK